jgi:hypothetical protein
MTEPSGRVVVKWVNNRSGLVCLTLENGETCLLHRTKLNVETGCNTRNLKRGSELLVSSKEENEWDIL